MTLSELVRELAERQDIDEKIFAFLVKVFLKGSLQEFDDGVGIRQNEDDSSRGPDLRV